MSVAGITEMLAAGQALLAANRFAEAEEHFRGVISIHPNHPAAHHGLGVALIRLQKHADAIRAFQKSLEFHPTPEAALNLIQLLHFAGRKSESVALARSMTAAFPNDPRLVAEFARVLERNNEPDEAMLACRRALVHFPDMPLLVGQLGGLLFARGQIAEAIELYRQYLTAQPGDHRIHSSLLFSLHFFPGMTLRDLLAEHQEWNRRHAGPLAGEIRPLTNSRNSNRPIRVGYVSPDFKNHGVGRFIAPLLQGHSREAFFIVAYSDVHTADVLTERIRSAVHLYRPTFHLSDARLAEQIRADEIDILVDLTMHMPSNRMLVFARKPAPVQMTYLAYCSTTGLSAMDYRLTDSLLEGNVDNSDHYSETSLAVPSYWCYEAPLDTTLASRDPEMPITFACLNNFAKASKEAMGAWAAILRNVPGSRLMLHAPFGNVRDEITTFFGEHQVRADRLVFVGRVPLEKYLELHGQADVALDPFPYAGGTTSCDALFMGTPVVTLGAAALPTGRAGVSILSQIGLERMIARDVPEYVRIATELARDPEELGRLRSTLRERMQRSRLMDARSFANSIESAYRDVWRRYCSK